VESVKPAPVLLRLYRDGIGVPANGTQAVAWLTKSAVQGLYDSQLALAQMYQTGADGIAANPQQAANWSAQAKQNPVVLAQQQAQRNTNAFLGGLLAVGIGAMIDGVENDDALDSSPDVIYEPAYSSGDDDDGD
jgi:TPR repeat protein